MPRQETKTLAEYRKAKRKERRRKRRAELSARYLDKSICVLGLLLVTLFGTYAAICGLHHLFPR